MKIEHVTEIWDGVQDVTSVMPIPLTKCTNVFEQEGKIVNPLLNEEIVSRNSLREFDCPNYKIFRTLEIASGGADANQTVSTNVVV